MLKMAVTNLNGNLDCEGGFSNPTDTLTINTIELLDDEYQSILTEVLKCAICLELPKRKQVLICEKGHHFCSTCHKKLKVCGICRGKLLESRNFVVEELVTKLGPILGILKNDLPPPEPPSDFTAGSYQCQHHCQTKAAAYQMLPHLRIKHSSELLENSRSNPYTGQFSWTFNTTFSPNESYTLSVHVSDMGLFTILINFKDLDFFGCIKMLGNKSVSLQYKYQMAVKTASKNVSSATYQFCIFDSPVASYCDDDQTINEWGNLLKINGANLLELLNVGSSITVFFSIEKQNVHMGRKKVQSQISAIVPDKPLVVYNNRKSRRNKSRNVRRKLLKAKLKTIASEESSNQNKLLEGLNKLSINRT